MYDLIQVGANTFYIECPAQIGIFRTGGQDVCLIDSGNDKNAGRKVRQVLDRNEWLLRAIYNTHSHADHIGGNAYLQNQTGCGVFVSGIDLAFTEHPCLEPALLYGGYVPEDLRVKLLFAEKCNAKPLAEESLPDGMTAIPLPGHCFDMVGYRTADDVVFLADCLSSEDTLRKYGIGYLYDVGAYLETLEAVKKMQASCFVPSHAPATENIAPLAQKNIDKVNEIIAKILDFCREPISFEILLKKMFDSYALTLNFLQYALVGSTVRSYLAWMRDRKMVDVIFEKNTLLWKTI